MLDLFVVSFVFWFHPFFLSQFVLSPDRRPPGLISVPFRKSSVAAIKDLIVFIRFNFIDIGPPPSFSVAIPRQFHRIRQQNLSRLIS